MPKNMVNAYILAEYSIVLLSCDSKIILFKQMKKKNN